MFLRECLHLEVGTIPVEVTLGFSDKLTSSLSSIARVLLVESGTAQDVGDASLLFL